MKVCDVDVIATNEQFVRMKIYDGDLTADLAYQELLSLEKAQAKAAREFAQNQYDRLSAKYSEACAEIRRLEAVLKTVTQRTP